MHSAQCVGYKALFVVLDCVVQYFDFVGLARAEGLFFIDCFGDFVEEELHFAYYAFDEAGGGWGELIFAGLFEIFE